MDARVDFPRRLISVLICVAHLAAPIGMAHAQVPTGPVALADVPVTSIVSIKPNVMFTLDNSGSMNWYFAPMTVVNFPGRYCQTAHSYNGLYFDPNQTYTPPILADGVTRLPNANYNNAWLDGYDTGGGTVNLSNRYSKLGQFNVTGFVTGNIGAYYMVYNGTSALDPTVCYPDASYTIVNMNTRTAQEQTNFANWFSYYSTRVNAMKTSVGEAFRSIGAEFRVGFHTINNPGAGNANGNFIPVDDFTGAQRTNWYNAFYAIQPNNSTPLRASLKRIGEYYRARISPVTNAALPLAQDPITASCQQNYHLLSTDGQWNDGNPGGPAGANNDSTIPNSPLLLDALNKEFSPATFAAGDPWPLPYREGAANSGSLADIATYYWMTDLRPTMANNVPTTAGDTAYWQHMTTFGIVFSEQGSIPYPNGINDILTGTSTWPAPAADSASAVDDMWHASLNGHGRYFNVTSPAALLGALSASLNEIRARSGSAAGVQFNSSSLIGSPNNYGYRPSFASGTWTGDVAAYSVNNSNAELVSLTPVWSAKAKLDALVAPTGPGGGWDLNRKIATRRSDTGAAVPFRFANLAPAQQLTLSPTDAARGQRIVDYLRGDRTNEDEAGVVREFRRRGAVLGDIIGSEATYVQTPSERYSDAYNPGYSTFKTSNANRRQMVYVGGNDGMLHAVDASVGNPSSGVEQWAYVPAMSYKTGVDGLAGLAWRQADPIPEQFSHRYRVDQTPLVQDVNFAVTNGGAGVNWRTLLVAGMNKGGKGYYALDVTSPEAASETDVTTKALWEFTGDIANDPKMGFSFGPPTVFKTRRFGWVVAVSSGYNNAAGTGHVWLLNPTNGAVLHRFDSGVGSPAIPSGLANTTYFIQSNEDYTAEQVYATDLMGNVFRFDVSSANAADWTSTGTKIASVGLPITSPPAVSINPFNPSERWVFFGTGRLLDGTDRTSTVAQTLFAIKDGGSVVPATVVTPLNKGALVNMPLNGGFSEGDNSIKGWYINLPVGQQMVNFPYVARGLVLFTTTNPTSDPCTPGATSTVYARAIGTGANVLNGVTSYTTNANAVKVQLVRVDGGPSTSSKGRYKLNFSFGDQGSGALGGDPANDPLGNSRIEFQLNGGRTAIRFLRTQ
jgi:type IV pilus assembly protein PilY1